MTRYPNLFLVGAPKCGTTSMAYYLGQHPDIFAPIVKEASYFGFDLTKRGQGRSKETYLDLYKDWSSQSYALDASAQYFVSRTAAGEIFDCNPDARILVMVRNPVDAVYSEYFQNRFDGVESIATFETALAAEEARLQDGMPPTRGTLEQLLYMRVYAYSANIARYQSVFGSERVTISVFDDFKRDPRAEFARVLNVLGLDPSCGDAIDFAEKNSAKRARSRHLAWFAAGPPQWAGTLAAPFLSKSRRLKIRNMITRINTVAARNPPMNPETRRQLISTFTPEVERLSALIGRDLTHWLQDDAAS